jgi:phosphoribosylformylglycinamidine synthase subunit PurS
MKFIAEIDVMPHKELLDPQGKAVKKHIGDIGISGVDDVRIGKHIQISIEADNESIASSLVDDACKRLLTNPIMEGYAFTLKPA